MLKGLGQLGDMAKIMKQAQEMQSRMADVQNRLDAIEVVGEAGAGLVRVTATAKGAVKRLAIDPSLFVPEEREVVEDLIVAAIQDAQARAMAAAQAEMAKRHRRARAAAGDEAAVLSMAEASAASIERLIALMARLPGLGPRSARRAVLAMVRRRELLLEPLAAALAEVAATVRECPRCGNIATGELCAICADPARGTGELCVVETVADLWAMERGGAFRGRYHVLGGVLSALDAVGPEALRIPELVARVGRARGRAR